MGWIKKVALIVAAMALLVMAGQRAMTWLGPFTRPAAGMTVYVR